jgi:ABC-type phosphate transport system auxiliary subunit
MKMEPEVVTPEEIVNSLSSAIANQLRMIQEQTKMLTLMQSELAAVTQAGSTERDKLLNEKIVLEQREQELQEELAALGNRMKEVLLVPVNINGSGGSTFGGESKEESGKDK